MLLLALILSFVGTPNATAMVSQPENGGSALSLDRDPASSVVETTRADKTGAGGGASAQPPASKGAALPKPVATARPSATKPTAPPSNVRPQPAARPVAPRPKPQTNVRIAPTPNAKYLGGIRHEYQDWFNCGPITTNMVMSYYGTYLSEAYTANKLRPNPKDVSVTALEMLTFAEIEYGFGGDLVWGGDMQMLQAFIANDFPVIVLQPLTPNSDINHFRVVRGYDRAAGTITVNDSQLGKNLVWSTQYFQKLWDTRSNSLALIYPKSRASLAKAIIVKHEPNERAVRTERVSEAQAEVRRSPYDPWAWLDLGASLYRTERYAEAVPAWERARELGLPEKALWYAAWPASLLNEVGRHREAIEIANIALARTPGGSEHYYERARAWDSIGERDLALQNLRLAVEFAPYHPRYRDSLRVYTQSR